MGRATHTPDEWWFESQPCARTQQPGLIQKKTLDRTLETFVREVLQNITDAGLDDATVEVTFKLETIDLDDNSDFASALCWSDLSEHARAAGEEQDGAGIKDYFDYLDNGGEFRVLRIEERNTSGISGNEYKDKTDYAALVRDPGRSNKGENKGGRHGLGSTVLWVASGVQTVLFCSELADSGKSPASPRFIGRSFLPTHEIGAGECYDTEGWYGSPTGLNDSQLERPESIWGSGASRLAEDLSIDRSDVSDPGTTTLIPGFRDPEDPRLDNQSTITEVLDTFEKAVVENFWPAISREGLMVKLCGAGETRELTAENISEYSSIEPFVQCYENWRDASDSIGGPGEVASTTVDYEVPGEREGEGSVNAELTVAARKAYPDEDEHQAEVAYFRGAGMVVDYKPGRYLGFNSKYHAVLIAGEARTPAEEQPDTGDKAVEELLSMAEPVQHDEWRGKKNEELKSEYQSGCVSSVEDVTTARLREGLNELFHSDEQESGEFVSPDRDILPDTSSLGDETGRDEPTPARPSVFNLSVDESLENNQWVFDGSVAPARDGATEWTATIKLVRMFEDGTEDDELELVNINVTGDADGTVSTDNTTAELKSHTGSEVKFKVISKSLDEIDPRLGEATQTRFKIDSGSITVEDDSDGTDDSGQTDTDEATIGGVQQ